jgi:YfiH family protein
LIQHNSKGVRYYAFESFPKKEVLVACFTRLGGISPEPYKSLNVGSSVGDQRSNVVENRKRLFNAISLPEESMYDAWQVHSTDYFVAGEPRDLKSEQKKVDILLTQNPKVSLMMRFADCVPIFLYGPRQRVIGLAHAGWMGSIKRIASKAIDAMVSEFNCVPGEIIAAIGPSIGPDHYEVGMNVVAELNTTFPENSDEFLTQKEDRYFLDLWELNASVLKQAGVKQIEIARKCTACDVDEWYSHRKEKGKTGRFGAIFSLV